MMNDSLPEVYQSNQSDHLQDETKESSTSEATVSFSNTNTVDCGVVTTTATIADAGKVTIATEATESSKATKEKATTQTIEQISTIVIAQDAAVHVENTSAVSQIFKDPKDNSTSCLHVKNTITTSATTLTTTSISTTTTTTLTTTSTSTTTTTTPLTTKSTAVSSETKTPFICQNTPQREPQISPSPLIRDRDRRGRGAEGNITLSASTLALARERSRRGNGKAANATSPISAITRGSNRSGRREITTVPPTPTPLRERRRTEEVKLSSLTSTKAKERSRRTRRGETPSSSASTSMMGVLRPSPVEVNGHALPQGVGERRDAPRNPSPLPRSPSASPVRHGERLIEPVIASVAPPPLQIADALWNCERIDSGNRRLRNMPVKRKLFDCEVDHEKLDAELTEELKQVVEEDTKRFKERYIELPPEVNPQAPSFYQSEVIPSNNKQVTLPTASIVATSSSSSSSLVVSSSTLSMDIASNSSVAATSTATAAVVEGSNNNGPKTEKDEGLSKVPLKKGHAEGAIDDCMPSLSSTPLFRSTRQKQNKNQNTSIPQSSPLASPAASTSSSSFSSLSPCSSSSLSSSVSINLSVTSNSSSSGVSSLESTPTHGGFPPESQQTVTPATTITPLETPDTPAQGASPPTSRGRIAATQETSSSSQKPTRLRRSSSIRRPDSRRLRKLPRI